MMHEYSRKAREETWRMMAEGRNEDEAEEIRHRNSFHSLDWDTIDWVKVDDTGDWVRIVLSRVIEKLYVLHIQEPSVFVGVEEDIEWIQRELMKTQEKYYRYSPEELMDVAYDFEDVIDDLILRSVSKLRRIGNWKRCLMLIRIHKKLELIKSMIPALPGLPIAFSLGGNSDNHFEEIIWSDVLLMNNQSMTNTVVSPVEEKVSALLALDAIHPYTKKKAMRVRSLNGFLKSLESVQLDDCGMVWIEELSHVVLSAVIAIEDFINKKQQFQKRSWMRPSTGFVSAFGFGKLKYEDKLAMEMDKIYAKIQNLSIHQPTAVNPQGQSSNPSNRIPSQPTMQEPNLTSFRDDVHAMIGRLLTEDESFRVIPIVGMEGIGRTTSAKLIFNHQAVIDHFPLGVWTSNGFQFHLRHKEKIMESNLSRLGQSGVMRSYNG